VLNIYYGKIEVVSFITTTGRKLIIVVKVDVNVKKWGRGSCFCCLLYLKFLGRRLMESS